MPPKKLPKVYSWLDKEPGPKMLKEGLALYGTVETPGAGNNPIIMGWRNETGLHDDFTSDAVPWCGLFIAVCAKRAGWNIVKNPLWALNWGGWEGKQIVPMLGDVMTFVRAGGGHVAMYVGEDPSFYHVLGGNQSDAVSIMRIPRTKMRAVRRPIWKVAQPENVTVRHLTETGAIYKDND